MISRWCVHFLEQMEKLLAIPDRSVLDLIIVPHLMREWCASGQQVAEFPFQKSGLGISWTEIAESERCFRKICEAVIGKGASRGSFSFLSEIGLKLHGGLAALTMTDSLRNDSVEGVSSELRRIDVLITLFTAGYEETIQSSQSLLEKVQAIEDLFVDLDLYERLIRRITGIEAGLKRFENLNASPTVDLREAKEWEVRNLLLHLMAELNASPFVEERRECFIAILSAVFLFRFELFSHVTLGILWKFLQSLISTDNSIATYAASFQMLIIEKVSSFSQIPSLSLIVDMVTSDWFSCSHRLHPRICKIVSNLQMGTLGVVENVLMHFVTSKISSSQDPVDIGLKNVLDVLNRCLVSPSEICSNAELLAVLAVASNLVHWINTDSLQDPSIIDMMHRIYCIVESLLKHQTHSRLDSLVQMKSFLVNCFIHLPHGFVKAPKTPFLQFMIDLKSKNIVKSGTAFILLICGEFIFDSSLSTGCFALNAARDFLSIDGAAGNALAFLPESRLRLAFKLLLNECAVSQASSAISKRKIGCLEFGCEAAYHLCTKLGPEYEVFAHFSSQSAEFSRRILPCLVVVACATRIDCSDVFSWISSCCTEQWISIAPVIIDWMYGLRSIAQLSLWKSMSLNIKYFTELCISAGYTFAALQNFELAYNDLSKCDEQVAESYLEILKQIEAEYGLGILHSHRAVFAGRFKLNNSVGRASNLQLAVHCNLQKGRQKSAKFFRVLIDNGLSSLSPENDLDVGDVESRDCAAEISWRNSHWDIDIPYSDSPTVTGLTLNELLLTEATASSHESRQVLEKSLCHIDASMQRLAVLSALFEKLDIQIDTKAAIPLMSSRSLALAKQFRFYEYERVIEYRHVILAKSLSNKPDPAVESFLKSSLLFHAQKARKAGYIQHALNSIASIPKLLDGCLISRLETIKCTWELGSEFAAIAQLKELIQDIDSVEGVAWYFAKFGQRDGPPTGKCRHYFKAKVTCLLAHWSGSISSEPNDVIENYFRTALELLERVDKSEQLKARSYYRFAQFVDSQYTTMRNSEHFRKMSRNCQMHSTYIDEMNKKLASLRNDEKVSIQIAKRNFEAQYALDTAEEARIKRSLASYSEMAFQHYTNALRLTDAYDISVFRLISLWFENSDAVSMNNAARDLLSRVPTWKFLPLVHQISAKLSAPADSLFGRILCSIMVKIGHDHPFHSLTTVFAARNSGVASVQTTAADESRNEAASHILAAISQKHESKAIIVSEMGQFCTAYHEFALTAVDKTKAGRIPMSPTLKIYRLGPLTHIHIPTVPLAIDASREYADIVSLKSVIREFELVGGINVPKKIQCIGSDNRRYSQLVKGNDDLRQDAVLQQVFGTLNNMLNRSASTQLDGLKMPTYTVIPLSPKAGILEWVENSYPIGSWLIKAHLKYNPNDWKPDKCRELMKKESSKTTWTPDSKLAVFSKILENFKPAMRYFFFEKCVDPREWFYCRRNYTQTCAVSFILCYLLGIGDRHAHNILLDSSGRVVHIDLGIAFDQGKLLYVPELVPARLTQDMVDGMGLSGTDGIFIKVAQDVLLLMKLKKDVIMTILEVFKHDPLYNWKLPNPLVRAEGKENDKFPRELEDNRQAERAIDTVRTKLSRTLKVECHVDELIRESRDPRNLSMMFHG
eukprot:Partr_v1_DN28901_c0_g1_i2_m24921 putative ataxia telangiectasia mutated